MTRKDEIVATIFCSPEEEERIAADLVDHATALVEHRINLSDLPHNHDIHTRARKVRVTVSLED